MYVELKSYNDSPNIIKVNAQNDNNDDMDIIQAHMTTTYGPSLQKLQNNI